MKPSFSFEYTITASTASGLVIPFKYMYILIVVFNKRFCFYYIYCAKVLYGFRAPSHNIYA